MEILLNILLLLFVSNWCLYQCFSKPIQDGGLVELNFQQKPINIDYDINTDNGDTNLEEAKNPDDEMMETANSWVFRPMFVYKKMQAQKKRVYAQKRYQNYVPRRNSYNPTYSFYNYDRRPSYYGDYYQNAKFPTLA